MPEGGEEEAPSPKAPSPKASSNGPPIPSPSKAKAPFKVPVSGFAAPEKLRMTESETRGQLDTNFLVVGDKGCGKTTLINNFTRASGAVKVTQGLEYQFVKREESKSTKCAHFWELGGGKKLDSLLEVMMTPTNINEVVVVICVNLSDPTTVFDSVHFWLTRVRKRVGAIFKQMSQKKSQTPSKMLARMRKQMGQNHPDIGQNSELMIIGVPIIIIPTHYDKFLVQDDTPKKIMAKTLRHLAHTFAACLIYTTSTDEREATRVRSIMQAYAWSGQIPNLAPQIDPAKPLFLLAGKDTYKDIGKPAEYQAPANFQSVGTQGDFDKWKMQFEQVFTKKAEVVDTGTDTDFDVWAAEFSEPSVDAMRRLRDQAMKK